MPAVRYRTEPYRALLRPTTTCQTCLASSIRALPYRVLPSPTKPGLTCVASTNQTAPCLAPPYLPCLNKPDHTLRCPTLPAVTYPTGPDQAALLRAPPALLLNTKLLFDVLSPFVVYNFKCTKTHPRRCFAIWTTSTNTNLRSDP